jgi:hypothetical protein
MCPYARNSTDKVGENHRPYDRVGNKPFLSMNATKPHRQPGEGGITGCERYCRPFFEPKINLHKIFKNNNRLMKFSQIVYLYLDFTFSR